MFPLIYPVPIHLQASIIDSGFNATLPHSCYDFSILYLLHCTKTFQSPVRWFAFNLYKYFLEKKNGEYSQHFFSHSESNFELVNCTESFQSWKPTVFNCIQQGATQLATAARQSRNNHTDHPFLFSVTQQTIATETREMHVHGVGVNCRLSTFHL